MNLATIIFFIYLQIFNFFNFRNLVRNPQIVAPIQSLSAYGAQTNAPVYVILTTTTAAPVYEENVNLSTTPKPVFSCVGKQDGYYYKNKCTSSFIICSKSKLFIYIYNSINITTF